MLLKKNRVPRSLFPLVFKNGRKYVSGPIFARVFHYDPTMVLPSRVSFVVSKKDLKMAVHRHILRRKGYFCVKKELKGIKKGFLIVFFFNKGANTLQQQDMAGHIIFILKKAGLYL